MNRLFIILLAALFTLSCESQVQDLEPQADDDTPPGYADIVIGPADSNGKPQISIATIDDPADGTIRCGRENPHKPEDPRKCKKDSRITWSIKNYFGEEVDVELTNFVNETTPNKPSPFAGNLKRKVSHEGRRPISRRIRNNADAGLYKYDIVVYRGSTEIGKLDPRIDIE